ncbi:MAG: HAD-IIB family hydrolase [Gammaproteobacteria bacterium]|nr:HAD-IIB family hydrolase [Gammaproteobacteria bacterium]MCP5137784.1 HAD-IIB family hydrolase [Gammaproteobacteria bacterium]
MEPLLICTDLDRTLIPNGNQPESPEAAARFAALVAHPEVHLAYVSGRHRGLVEEAIAHYALPMPEYVIGDVGSSMDHRIAGNWRRMIEWEQRIAPDWAGLSHDDLAGMLADVAGLRLQEADKQNRFKLSYYHDTTLDVAEVQARVAPRFVEAGVRARMIWSVDETSDTGLLDVLPASASKYHAIRALMGVTGFGLGNTVFCGDSGNDLEVLVSPVSAVLVGNAQQSVRDRAVRQAAEAGYSGQLYLARGGFMGMNGNYRGGMLEGIAHYQPQVLAALSR